jgi:hypothetical protein
MLTCRHTLIAAAAACAALAIPSVASAEDFCVGDPAGCIGTPVPPPLLHFALAQAQSNGTDDRFMLAPGTYASTAFSHDSSERVQIVGAGAGKTILSGNLDEPVLTLGGNPDSSVADLTLEPVGTATGGLTLKGTQAHRVAVDAKGVPSLFAGVQLYGDAAFEHGSVDIGTAQQYAVVVLSGDGSVTDSTLTAPEGAGFAAGGGEATVRRSTLDAKFGAYAGAGHLTISDTLVDLRGHAVADPAYGVYVSPGSGGNITAATADADRLTIVGSPSAATSAGVVALADGAGKSATVHVRDSVISGIDIPVGRQADNGATADLTTTRSAYPSSVAPYDIGPGSLVEQNRLQVNPRFVGNGDFHLAADSPLIDAGTPGSVGAGAVDRDGRPRASDGDGECAHVPDIGAFEYQGIRVRAMAAAAAATVSTGQPVGFSAAGSCIPGPGEPTIRWSFDDGATAPGAAVTHAFQTPGRHTATATVSDQDGHSAVATAAVEVSAPAAGTPTAPRISRLRVTPTRVQIGKPLPKLVRGPTRRLLATIGFHLSKRATVTLQFAKLRPNRAPRKLATTVRITARKGQNGIRFAARLSRRVTLTPGAYRLTVVATDPAGNRSKPANTRFTAVNPAR